jgi:hypothetical protein
LEQQKKDHTLANKTSNQPTIQNEQGKNMVKCLVFDILKSPHFTSTKILAVIILSNYKSYNYPLCVWSKTLVGHHVGITKHVIGSKIHVKSSIFQCETDYK